MGMTFNGKKSISLDTLSFVKPFTGISNFGNQHKGNPVFLEGLSRKQGVLVVRYKEPYHRICHQIKFVFKCLNSSAMSIYKLAKLKGIEVVEFSTIPCTFKEAELIMKRLREDLKKKPVDDHLSLLGDWFINPTPETFPSLESFQTSRPFVDFGKFKKFSLLQYRFVSGLYLIYEHTVQTGEKSLVYVGKSVSVLSDRMRAKFYPNPHLHYREIEGVREYLIVPVEVSPRTIRRKEDFASLIDKYESILINVLRPRDNKLGNPDYFADGWKPIVNDSKEMPF